MFLSGKSCNKETHRFESVHFGRLRPGGCARLVSPNAFYLLRMGRMEGRVEIPGLLEVHPELRFNAQETLQSQGSVRSNAALSVDELVDARKRHADALSEGALRDIHRLQEFFQQHLTGMRRRAVCRNANH